MPIASSSGTLHMTENELTEAVDAIDNSVRDGLTSATIRNVSTTSGDWSFSSDTFYNPSILHSTAFQLSGLKGAKIFADFHHSSLFYSFYLTFVKRLGMELYHPIGEEWFREGYWGIAKPYNDNPDTVKQYLQLDGRYTPKDGTQVLNEVVGKASTHYGVYDHQHDYIRNCITFDQFKNMDIDFVIGSIPIHWKMYRDLVNKYKPKAKLICHAGNHFQELKRYYEKNFLLSLRQDDMIHAPNVLYYYQEFPLDIFHHGIYHEEKKIFNFVNCFDTADLFKNDYKLWCEVRKILEPKGWEFRSYGAQNEHGSISTIKELADRMREAKFIWHTKKGADGYGHIVHNAAAVGTPLISIASYYSGKMGSNYMTPNCSIQIEEGSLIDSIADSIEFGSQPEIYLSKKENLIRQFDNEVNFKQEANELVGFLNSCI